MNSDPSKGSDVQQVPSVETISDYKKPADAASVNITKVKIDKDILTMEVSYAGGCEKHGFRLIFSGIYRKSMPPQASLYLEHNANGDACRSIVEETLRFNIQSMRYNPGKPGKLIIDIEGFSEKVEYVY